MDDDLQIRVQSVFRDVFDDDKLLLQGNTSPETFPAWDSLGHIRLIAALEDELQLTFTLEEIEDMNSAAKILALLSAKV